MKSQKCAKGISTLEFSLCAVVILPLFFGIISILFLFNQQLNCMKDLFFHAHAKLQNRAVADDTTIHFIWSDHSLFAKKKCILKEETIQMPFIDTP